MSELRILSASEQVASHMREQISRRIWTGTMPGGGRLSRELGVGRMTVESALAILEEEGLLETQGIGKRRRISPLNDQSTPNLRVAILLYAPDDSTIYYNVDMQHRLLNAGHFASFTSKTLVELGMDPKRIARFVESTPADAWIVSSGSREVLKWFSEHHLPTFAFAGRRHEIRIASTGPDKEAALRSLMQRLVDLGHRSIVMLAQAVRCKPEPGRFEQLFLDELAAHGIKHSSFNLPDWKDSAEGLQEVLDNLFRYTSPTALIIQETHTFIAVQQHLAQRGILAPRDVSLISDEPASLFTWCRPTVAHINWDGGQIARRAVRWANNVAQGKDDRRCSFIKSEFVDGGTLGPVPKGRAETKVVAPLTKSP